ncbi:MAG: hypothetical protein HKM93_11985 [Desulfobacteraceae bacterium]|nr:hypothetical protein [Desulfobacteraceae bacterium]
MEINGKPQISPNNADGLKKQTLKGEKKGTKTTAGSPAQSREPNPEVRVNLSKESITAASGLEGRKGSEVSGDPAARENEAQAISLAAGKELSKSGYGLTTGSAQKLFEAFI